MKRPKFSVLLPTRDRLAIAKGAIETVRRQVFSDWELVIADNCSADDVKGYVSALGDPRIICIRSDIPLSVTDNWNKAIDASTGEWVVMLGDDDGLTPNYFESVSAAIDALDHPDFLQQGAYNFIFPGVVDRYPLGVLIDELPYVQIMRGRNKPALLSESEAQRAAVESMSLHSVFSLGAPYNIFSRRFIDKIKKRGAFYQSPFPDFYIVMMGMLVSERVGVIPERLVIRGTSKNSYSHFVANQDIMGGLKYLKIENFLDHVPAAIRARLLPGPMMNTGWLLAALEVKRQMPDRAELPLALTRYRMLQIFDLAKSEVESGEMSPAFKEAYIKLSILERLFTQIIRLGLAPARLLNKTPRRAWITAATLLCRQYPVFPYRRPQRFRGSYRDIVDVFEQLSVSEPIKS